MSLERVCSNYNILAIDIQWINSRIVSLFPRTSLDPWSFLRKWLDSLKQKVFLKFFVRCTVFFRCNFSFLVTNFINTLVLTATRWLQWMRISKSFPLSFSFTSFFTSFSELFSEFVCFFEQLPTASWQSWTFLIEEFVDDCISGISALRVGVDKDSSWAVLITLSLKRSFARPDKLDVFTKSF